MVTDDLFMLRGFCFLTRIIVKLILEQVILSNPAMMRQGSELIKTGSFVISRNERREHHRRQAGLQRPLLSSFRTFCEGWLFEHLSALVILLPSEHSSCLVLIFYDTP